MFRLHSNRYFYAQIRFNMQLTKGTDPKGVYKERLQRPEYIDMKPLVGLDVAERIMRSCKSGKTLVYFDPDMDGLGAGYFFCQVLDHLGIEYKTHVNTNREHGFQLQGKDYVGWTVLNGDFLVTEEQAIDLLKHNVSLLSVDHHECQDGMIHYVRSSTALRPGTLWHNGRPGKPAYTGVPLDEITAEVIVINNQYPFEDTRNLFQSGAGVTFLALKDAFPFLDTPTNRALVGVTLITDIRDIETPGAYAWLYEAYHSKYEGTVKRIIDNLTRNKRRYEFGLPRFDRAFISYTLSPMLNALFRFNREEEAVDFILGHAYPSIDYQAKQKELVADIVSKATIQEYQNFQVVKIDANDFDYEVYSYLSNFVGLVASRITDKGKPVIAYSTNYVGEVTRASFRGTAMSAPYREVLEPVIDGRGHSIAFGIKNMVPSDDLFKQVDPLILKAEQSAVQRDNYIEVRNLDIFNRSALTTIAERNDYLMEQNQVYLRYTGNSVVVETDRPTYVRYRINGVLVTSFDPSLSVKDGLIHVYLSRGNITYNLRKPFNESRANLITDTESLMQTSIKVK